MKRSKRLKKGILSLDKQIEIHLKKLKKAKDDENEYLMNYYEKEIEGIKREKKKKEGLLD